MSQKEEQHPAPAEAPSHELADDRPVHKVWGKYNDANVELISLDTIEHEFGGETSLLLSALGLTMDLTASQHHPSLAAMAASLCVAASHQFIYSAC